jgi:hypothetical protein
MADVLRPFALELDFDISFLPSFREPFFETSAIHALTVKAIGLLVFL